MLSSSLYYAMSKIHNYNLFLKRMEEAHNKIHIDKPTPASSNPWDPFLRKIDFDFHRYKHDAPQFNGVKDDPLAEIEWQRRREGKRSRPIRISPEVSSQTLEELLEEVVTLKPGSGGSPIELKFDPQSWSFGFKVERGPKTKVCIQKEIKSIGDLIQLTADYPLDPDIEYNIQMETLHQIKDALVDLNNMVGLKAFKENIVNQIIYFIQDLHTNETGNLSGNLSGNSKGDFMHTVIYGPPGTGKTEVAKIMGKIYSQMGLLKKGVFMKVTRADLIAGYLGQTAMKTKEVIKECLGGVLFIDEAYSLGNPEKKDSFSKECIDTLCEALSHHKNDLMVIIAGYEQELKECFFNYNQGLESRFPWKFKTDSYDGKELYEIFKRKVESIGWVLDESVKSEWFDKRKENFTFFGRDMETLLFKVKIAHSRRIFCKENEDCCIRKTIVLGDLEKGYEQFINREDADRKKRERDMIAHIYV